MTRKDYGGPAFPQPGATQRKSGGMSLRDWFAGQALMGVLANRGHSTPEWLAKTSYEVADAMIKERSRDDG